MKIRDLVKCVLFGSAVSQVTFAGVGGLPGPHTEDYSDLEKEFIRKRKPLSVDTINKFNLAASAHAVAEQTRSQRDWHRALVLYRELRNGHRVNGKGINLLEKSYVVTHCLYRAFKARGDAGRATYYKNLRDRLLRKAQKTIV